MIWCAVEAHHIEQFPESRPSLLRYSPALVLVVVAIADIQRWADPDLWGHLAFGRAMLAARHLAFHDPYSYSAPGHLWINHEWLSESMLAAIYNLGGVVGLKLMKFACCASDDRRTRKLALAEIDSPLTLQFRDPPHRSDCACAANAVSSAALHLRDDECPSGDPDALYLSRDRAALRRDTDAVRCGRISTADLS